MLVVAGIVAWVGLYFLVHLFINTMMNQSEGQRRAELKMFGTDEEEKEREITDDLVDRVISMIHEKPDDWAHWGIFKEGWGGNSTIITLYTEGAKHGVGIKADGRLFLRHRNTKRPHDWSAHQIPLDAEQECKLQEAFEWLKAEVALRTLDRYDLQKEQAELDKDSE